MTNKRGLIDFSWWMTPLLHRLLSDRRRADANDFDRKVQRAELDFLARSSSAQAALAENYVGLPY